jgi:hypothetical protein
MFWCKWKHHFSRFEEGIDSVAYQNMHHLSLVSIVWQTSVTIVQSFFSLPLVTKIESLL